MEYKLEYRYICNTFSYLYKFKIIAVQCNDGRPWIKSNLVDRLKKKKLIN